jgi:hypothetical protein
VDGIVQLIDMLNNENDIFDICYYFEVGLHVDKRLSTLCLLIT